MYCLHLLSDSVISDIPLEMEENQQTVPERVLLNQMQHPELSHYVLGILMNIHHSTISRVLQRFHEQTTEDNKPEAGQHEHEYD